MSETITRECPTMFEVCAGDIDELNGLLRGELSAVEAYEDAIDKFDDWKSLNALSKLRDNHSSTAIMLRDLILDRGGKPATHTGLWGHFATVVTRIAAAFGPQTVLVALKEGEEIGYGQYEAALRNPDVSDELKSMVEFVLLCNSREHMDVLDRIVLDCQTVVTA